jgi:FkbM family methyltransferase
MLVIQVITNPWLFARKAAGRIRRRMISPPEEAVEKTINGCVRFEHKPLTFLDDDDYRAMLTESYDINLTNLFRESLRPGDIVIDAGANVGYVSAFAASLVGPSGEVHGFEPLQECFDRLRVLQKLNPEYTLVFTNAALGQTQGSLPISYDPKGGSRNATLVPGYPNLKTLGVPVIRLDDYISLHISQPERIKMIKIDVEGFEFPVLLGAEKFFANTSFRPQILCELKPYEIAKCGFTLEDLRQYMKRFGYGAYDSVQHKKVIDLLALTEMEVLLFKA